MSKNSDARVLERGGQLREVLLELGVGVVPPWFGDRHRVWQALGDSLPNGSERRVHLTATSP
jgi:hypothetical protein